MRDLGNQIISLGEKIVGLGYEMINLGNTGLIIVREKYDKLREIQE